MIMIRRWFFLLAPFAILWSLRLYLIPTHRMPFDSDEAILLLMARHIVDGARPVFFYGEAYGGSTDSYITAVFYALFGDTVTVGRLVQTLEYSIYMVFSYLLARRIFPDAKVAPVVMLWLMAIPPLMMTTWTTPSVLYAIVMMFGSIITYMGHRILLEDADRRWMWLLFGFVCGLAFWTFGILVVYMLPVFLLFLWHFKWSRLPNYILSAVMFFVGSAPWWPQAIAGLSVVSDAGFTIPYTLRLLAFASIMLPGFFGIREPWQSDIVWFATPALVIYLMAILYFIPRLRRDQNAPQLESTGFALLSLQVGVWLLLYFGTRFSVDASGRYILPLYPVLFVATALFLERLYRWRWQVALGVLAILLGVHLGMHFYAIRDVPPGITAQMNGNLWFGNQDDAELIAFIKSKGGRGYSHHWIAYKINFLSNEAVILAALLPYRPDLGWSPLDDRYAPYVEAVESSPKRVFVTHREPNLDEYLRTALINRNILFATKDIGPYRVYHGFDAPVTPQDLGLGPGQN